MIIPKCSQRSCYLLGHNVMSNLHERTTDKSPAEGVMVYTCKVVDESNGTSGVLVLCHSICVIKWMNGIKAQSLWGAVCVTSCQI